MLCIETPGVSRKNVTPLCLHVDIKTGMSTIICPLPFQIREFRYCIVWIFFMWNVMLSDVYKILLPCFLASCGLDIYITIYMNSNIFLSIVLLVLFLTIGTIPNSNVRVSLAFPLLIITNPVDCDE